MKKGQITLFIIVGLVLLLGVIIGYAMYADYLVFKPPEQFVTQDLPTQLGPVTAHIQECQQDLLDEGARRLLSTGGYLEPRIHGVLALPPPAGRAAELGPDQPVAYWRHFAGGAEESEQPGLYGAEASSISRQLAEYLDENLESCTDFSQFPEFDIVNLTAPVTTVTFGEDQTFVETAWRLEVTNEQIGVSTIETTASRANIPIQKLYDTASETISIFSEFTFPEERTLDWLGVYASGVGNDLPPVYWGYEPSDDLRIWSLANAQDDMDELTQFVAQTIQLIESREWQLTTSNEFRINDLYQKGLFGVPDPVPDMKFRAYALGPTNWRVNNNPAAAIPRIMPQPGYLNIVSQPLVDYSFYYDITYPLVLTFEEDGYTLNVAYEVNIDQGRAANATAMREEPSEEYCFSAGGADAIIRVEPWEDTQVLFTCGQQTCLLDQPVGGVIETVLPTCAEGTLSASAPDLFSEDVPVSSNAEENLDVTLRLYEEQTTLLALEKLPVVPINEDEYELGSLGAPAQAQVIFVRQGEPYFAETQTGGEITLVPGTYDVYAYDIREYSEEEPYTIPSKLDCGLNPMAATSAPICAQTAAAEAASSDKTYQEAFGECMGNVGCAYYPEVNFTTVIMGYADFSGERGIEISSIPDRITLQIAGFDETDFTSWDDIGRMGAMFDLANEQEPQASVRFN